MQNEARRVATSVRELEFIIDQEHGPTKLEAPKKLETLGELSSQNDRAHHAEGIVYGCITDATGSGQPNLI